MSALQERLVALAGSIRGSSSPSRPPFRGRRLDSIVCSASPWSLGDSGVPLLMVHGLTSGDAEVACERGDALVHRAARGAERGLRDAGCRKFEPKRSSWRQISRTWRRCCLSG